MLELVDMSHSALCNTEQSVPVSSIVGLHVRMIISDEHYEHVSHISRIKVKRPACQTLRRAIGTLPDRQQQPPGGAPLLMT